MEIEATEQFEQDYLRLSRQDRASVDRAIGRLSAKPELPGLRFARLGGHTDPLGRDIWYFRASDSLRVTCARDGDMVFLRKVGHHDILARP